MQSNGNGEGKSEVRAFAVFDSKASAYMNPFFLPTVGMAIRSFTKAAMEPDHDFHYHGADYTLMEIGTWDPTTGVLERLEVPLSHGTAIQHRSNYEIRQTAPLTDPAAVRTAIEGSK